MARTIKKYSGITIGRKCSNCGKDVWIHIMEDDAGKFVVESCCCKLEDIMTRLVNTNVPNAYSIPDYIKYINTQIAALSAAKEELEKLL